MAATALHIVRKVLPDCPVRQWVLSVPFPIRRLLAADAKLFGAVVKLFARVVERFYLQRAQAAGIEAARTGALSFQQRFGGSLNAHCHIHAVWVDGVFALDANTSEPRFHFTAPPSLQDVQRLAALIAVRVNRMLRRKGLLREPSHDSNEAPTVDDALDACRNVGHGRGRFERIDARGRSQQELFPEQPSAPARRTKSPLAAEVDGYSVEAGVQFGALDRKGREQLVRYCLRPAIANERLSILRDGSVAYRTKYPKGRRTHRVMQPMEFLARLAAIVPPPRFPLWRYHGVLAPGAPWRKHIVPASAPDEGGCSHKAATSSSEPARKGKRPRKPTGDPSLLRGSPEPAAPTSDKPSWRPNTSYVPWAELLRHCFGEDALDCPRCHSRLEPVAVIRRLDVIERILRHLALPLAPAELTHPDTVRV